MMFTISDSSVSPSRSDDTDKKWEKSQADSLFLSCTPDRPVIFQGESIPLKAWVTTPEGKPLESELIYAWSVHTGIIRDRTAEVQWDLQDTKPGNYVATVRIAPINKEVTECSLQIVIEPPEGDKGIQLEETRGGRETGRFFLSPKQQEHKGYGLYSYLLFGGPPSDNSRERYLKTIEAYLTFISDIARLEKYFAPSELNITYLSINAIPPDITDTKLLARWMLDHYDYDRSRFLIRQLPGENREGPYIVSVSSPLSGTTRLHSPYLWQDLSAVPGQLAGSWLKEFMNQAAQEHFWEARSLSQIRLKVRSAIAVLAIGWPDVRNSLDSYIKVWQSVSP
jgi:hypothetical protein